MSVKMVVVYTLIYSVFIVAMLLIMTLMITAPSVFWVASMIMLVVAAVKWAKLTIK